MHPPALGLIMEKQTTDSGHCFTTQKLKIFIVNEINREREEGTGLSVLNHAGQSRREYERLL